MVESFLMTLTVHLGAGTPGDHGRMEVEEIRVIGLPMPETGSTSAKVTGLSWDRDKIVAAAITEVMPHPNADRLTLCHLLDGQEERIVLTGAPNLYEFKGKGVLPVPLKVA
jgi:phenylalanyl-tRNA synthetase beta chain